MGCPGTSPCRCAPMGTSPSAVGLRLDIKKMGCSGFAYVVDLTDTIADSFHAAGPVVSAYARATSTFNSATSLLEVDHVLPSDSSARHRHVARRAGGRRVSGGRFTGQAPPRRRDRFAAPGIQQLLGTEVVRPTRPDERNVHASIFRFDSYENLETWMGSSERKFV